MRSETCQVSIQVRKEGTPSCPTKGPGFPCTSSVLEAHRSCPRPGALPELRKLSPGQAAAKINNFEKALNRMTFFSALQLQLSSG